ncbi:hypothetical protein MRB53_009949 [Persea americana]|uniref:Uncharacterized protein n=1 Tax=Persea americana TaxID=3435 RepID=A0ACC2LQI7_PERAE|nr:hypothetical protein MRB53_009949 [Persea americana]
MYRVYGVEGFIYRKTVVETTKIGEFSSVDVPTFGHQSRKGQRLYFKRVPRCQPLRQSNQNACRMFVLRMWSRREANTAYCFSHIEIINMVFT